MREHSSMHSHLSWAKERIDEMEATLASIEARAAEVKAGSKAEANQALAAMKKAHAEFNARFRKAAEAGEAALQAVGAQLESDWHAFEVHVRSYFEATGRQMEQQQATFRDVAAAQFAAWRGTAEDLRREVAKLAATGRADVEDAISQMQESARVSEARLQNLKQAGNESWTALNSALGESRRAFDRANDAAWDALKRATTGKGSTHPGA
jgi:hypothetical protein